MERIYLIISRAYDTVLTLMVFKLSPNVPSSSDFWHQVSGELPLVTIKVRRNIQHIN